MRQHRTSTLLVATLFVTSLAAAAPQEKPVPPANPAEVFQIVKEAHAFLQSKDYEATRQSSLKALAMDARNQYALYYLGRASDMLGQLSDAETAYRKLIAINPRHAYAYVALGLLYGKQGRTDEAIAYFTKQLDVTPRSLSASANLARAFAFQFKWAEALPHAALAAELGPEQPGHLQFLGKIQMKTGHIDDARRTFDRALALPHEAGLENDVAYELADAGVDLDRSWKLIGEAIDRSKGLICETAAVADADKCASQLRRIAPMLDTAGWVLYRQGKILEAEPYLRSSFAIDPRGAVGLHVAIVLAKLGRLDEGAKLFADVRTRPNFDLADTTETLKELTEAAGGEAKLDALVDRVAPPVQQGLAPAKVIAVVDSTGRVVRIESSEPALPGVVEAAKALILPALSWPGHALRSIRTIEFLNAGGQWAPVQSYAGITPPPPPCGIVVKPLILVTRDNGSPARARGCPADF